MQRKEGAHIPEWKQRDHETRDGQSPQCVSLLHSLYSPKHILAKQDLTCKGGGKKKGKTNACLRARILKITNQPKPKQIHHRI